MDLRKKGFQMPEKIRFEEETLTDTYGKLFAEPLERGFGTTLGGALRRVLLSSIEGAAATGVRIIGALHEFATIEGVKFISNGHWMVRQDLVEVTGEMAVAMEVNDHFKLHPSAKLFGTV